MAEYTLEVTTGSMLHEATFDNLFVTLIGTEGQSEPTQLTSVGWDENPGNLEKDPFHESPEREWFCSKVVVTTPEGDEILFPCHRWLSRGEFVFLRGGRATKAFEDLHPRLLKERKKELLQQKLTCVWAEYADGMSYVLNIPNPRAVPSEISYSPSKASQFKSQRQNVRSALHLKALTDEPWESFEAMKEFPWFKDSPSLEYVSQHWQDDDFFGYQFLNGANPHSIRRCSALPSNFPVTDEMVKPFLANGSSLTSEMEKGNIFIIDYKIMEGLPTRVVDGKLAALAAPLCLLYLNTEKKLQPIAIQLHQQPSEQNPIFLPSDLKSDWLLAKIFVKHADTLHVQLLTHLLNPHLLAETFAMATLRNLPMIHPLHKLLIPHHRFTLHTNIFSRALLYGPGRILTNTSLDVDGLIELLKRGFAQTNYSSLCLPENIAARGVESIPNFHYKDDALRLWRIINGFVKAVVAYYYPSDSEVAADSELQEWINEIFYYGFQGNGDSGIPSSFQTVEELIKFVTMVIFTTSVQHAVIGNAQRPFSSDITLRAGSSNVLQERKSLKLLVPRFLTDQQLIVKIQRGIQMYFKFDFLAWIPNGPFMLNRAPPTTKGQSSMEAILATLTHKQVSGLFVSTLWLISRKSDFTPLGSYPEQRFDEPAALQMIKDFQAELSSLSAEISKRNSELELPYNYLNPEQIENSVAN